MQLYLLRVLRRETYAYACTPTARGGGARRDPGGADDQRWRLHHARHRRRRPRAPPAPTPHPTPRPHTQHPHTHAHTAMPEPLARPVRAHAERGSQPAHHTLLAWQILHQLPVVQGAEPPEHRHDASRGAEPPEHRREAGAEVAACRSWAAPRAKQHALTHTSALAGGEGGRRKPRAGGLPLLRNPHRHRSDKLLRVQSTSPLNLTTAMSGRRPAAALVQGPGVIAGKRVASIASIASKKRPGTSSLGSNFGVGSEVCS